MKKRMKESEGRRVRGRERDWREGGACRKVAERQRV